MKKNLFLLIIFFHQFLCAQNIDSLKKQSLKYYEIGDIRNALCFLENYPDDEKTKSDIWQYKTHLKSILAYDFTQKAILNLDHCIERVTFEKGIISTMGIYSANEKRYIIPPIYDKVGALSLKKDLILLRKNGKSGIADINGKILLPLAYHNIGQHMRDFIGVIGLDFRHSLYDIDLNLLLKDYFEFVDLDHSDNYFLAYKTKSDVRLIEKKTMKVLAQGSSIEAALLSNFEASLQEIFFNRRAFNKLNIQLIKVKNNSSVKLYALSNESGLQYINEFEEVYFENGNIDKIINNYESAKNPLSQYKESKHYIPFKRNGKIGIYCVDDNSIYKEPILEDIDEFGNGIANGKKINILFDYPVSLFNYGSTIVRNNTLMFEKEGKIGLMNYKAQPILDAEYDEFYNWNGNNVDDKRNLLFLRNGYSWGFLNLNDRLIQKAVYDLIPMGAYEGDVYYTYKDQQYFKRNIFATDSMEVYKQAENFIQDDRKNFYQANKDTEKKTEIKKKKTVTSFFKDLDINIMEYGSRSTYALKKSPAYPLELYKFTKTDDKYGMKISYESNGKENIKASYPALFDSIKYLKGNYFQATLNGKMGLIDENYQCILNYEYEDIKAYYFDFVDDPIFRVKKGGKYGLMNKNFNYILPAEYEDIQVYDNQTLSATQNGKNYYLLIQSFTSPNLFNIFEHTERKYALKQYHPKLGINIFSYVENGKTGLVDYHEKELLAPVYEDALFVTTSNNKHYSIVKNNNQYYFSDQDGKILVSEPISIDKRFLYPELFNVYYPSGIFEKAVILKSAKTQKMGLYDFELGKMIIPFKYDDLEKTNSRSYKNEFASATIYEGKDEDERRDYIGTILDIRSGKTIFGPTKGRINFANDIYFSVNGGIYTMDGKIVAGQSDPGVKEYY
ncbi:WG repeat-containing protein [Chryseobacterium arachidis]|uniref:WG repeat-containing protein n=1 Tax=Chryseobacterium arachidis TaxID=1416778 RepID=UPI001160CD7C|nr:WG repeat-containing protein [Chryseobacterium arachidis]